MKDYEFKAVTVEGAIYCIKCLPTRWNIRDLRVRPIFASDEWNNSVVCDKCFKKHDYMKII